jgi:hypothetical protein
MTIKTSKKRCNFTKKRKTIRNKYKGGEIKRKRYKKNDKEEMYLGELKDGEPHGKGKMGYKNGDVYQGNFEDGKMNGQGKMTLSNGDKYDGEFKNDMKHGKGKYSFASGAVYDGEWKNNKFEGRGKYLLANGDVLYDGEWKNGTKDGKGKYLYTDGDVYDGEWKNDKIHGKGKILYANGDVYDGEWVDNKPKKQKIITLNNIDIPYNISIDETGFDIIDGYINIQNFLTDDSDNFLFIINSGTETNEYRLFNKENLKTILNDESNYVYICKEISHKLMISKEDLRDETEYINLRKLGMYDYALVEQIQYIANNNKKDRIFMFTKTQEEAPSVVSWNIYNNPGTTVVSASHCQEGQGGFIYNIETVDVIFVDKSKTSKTSKTSKDV